MRSAMDLTPDSANGIFGLLRFAAAVLLLIQVANGQAKGKVDRAPQWQEIELEFNATRERANAYTEVEGWVIFAHDDGSLLRRPMFCDGGRTFRVRFASTRSSGAWHWRSFDRDGDPGLHGHSGTPLATNATDATASLTIFTRHGFWSIPPGGRTLIHADGRPRLLCADTPWALQWRATFEQAEIYARDR